MRTTQDHIILHWLKKPLLSNKNLTIFDVGINLGDWTSLCLTSLPYNIKKIYGFEPNIETYKTVSKKYENINEVSVFNTALSSTEKETNLYIPGNIQDGKWKHTAHALSSLVDRPVFHTWPDCNLGAQKIKTSTIDNVVKSNNIETIDYLKIDVEGLEFEVLKGAAKSLKNGIIKGGQFEYGSTFQDVGIRLKDVIQFLNDYGYNVYDTPNFISSGLSKNYEDDWDWCNLMFLKR